MAEMFGTIKQMAKEAASTKLVAVCGIGVGDDHQSDRPIVSGLEVLWRDPVFHPVRRQTIDLTGTVTWTIKRFNTFESALVENG
jgi:hypothetical protein